MIGANQLCSQDANNEGQSTILEQSLRGPNRLFSQENKIHGQSLFLVYKCEWSSVSGGLLFLSRDAFLNESPLWGKSYCWVSDLDVTNMNSILWGVVFLLRDVFLNETPSWGKSSSWLSGLSIPLRTIFLDESPFWRKCSCCVSYFSIHLSELLFWVRSSRCGILFSMILLSGSCPSVGFLMTCLDLSSPVRDP